MAGELCVCFYFGSETFRHGILDEIAQVIMKVKEEDGQND
jgi:hypothetical protein